MADRHVPVNSILTNGTLINQENAEAIVEAGVELVQVSIDGDKGTHEKIRGVRGCYEKAIRGIKLIQSIREKRGNTRPDIRINCVISSENVYCLDSLVDLAEELHVQLQFQHLMWLNKEQIDRHKDFLKERFDFEDTTIKNLENNLQCLDLKLLEEKLRNIKQECQKKGIPLYFLQFSDKQTIEKWYTDLSFVPRRRCLEPFLVARITANGDLKFCPLIDYSYGNVKLDKFETLWKGNRAKEIRAELRRKGLFHGCVRCCKL
jgi:MoaA/NifB/PqqE/SkfB family radical SAM enzyme